MTIFRLVVYQFIATFLGVVIAGLLFPFNVFAAVTMFLVGLIVAEMIEERSYSQEE